MKSTTQYFFHTNCRLFACILVGSALACCSTGDDEVVPRKTGSIVHYAADSHIEPTQIPPACSLAWNQLVDSRLGISDARGHGPDVGSEEWMFAVGRRSGVIDEAGHGPDPGSEEWCQAVDFRVFGRR